MNLLAVAEKGTNDTKTKSISKVILCFMWPIKEMILHVYR